MVLVAKQCAKKGKFDSLGQEDFAIGQVIFWGEFKLQKNCNQSCLSNFFRLVEMTFNDSLPKWQAVKLSFFCTLS